MDHPLTISGIHHLTAISGSARTNATFYRDLLGLRLVKKTVNFDDPFTYHLYYGDRYGRPGSLMTFFPWDGERAGQTGAGMIESIALAVPPGSLDFWEGRLSDAGFKSVQRETFGAPCLVLGDAHGLGLELVEAPGSPAAAPWREGPVPEDCQITGIHGVRACLYDVEEIKDLLTRLMGLTAVGEAENIHRFGPGDSSGGYYDIRVDPTAPQGRAGTGTVHHIAFRTRDDAEQAQWQHHLRRHGFQVTESRDRNYFNSIYFRSPGGVLFEIATDPPGFLVDENEESLGTSLQLPPQYEARRGEIEGRLPPL